MPNAQSLRWFEPWPNRERDDKTGELISRPAEEIAEQPEFGL
jgi:hypothetical protein